MKGEKKKITGQLTSQSAEGLGIECVSLEKKRKSPIFTRNNVYWCTDFLTNCIPYLNLTEKVCILCVRKFKY